ncbi:aspartyl protease family protein At5g10770-like [Durio zibethinus]|uniref:Aspartyl protease family protein At5g10770-like n=1 Tax=Durio zibethinus TaxID=66656 RepID=A0A6P5XWA9_DURZI|nr:aspartyl protease family protein At5g10770-like [Durio zibethinus]
MATSIFSNLFSFLLPPFLFFILLLHSSKNSYALQEKMSTLETKDFHLHVHFIKISSLLPSTVCNSSTKVINKKSSLEVVHKHGPCFASNQDRVNAHSHAEILSQDQSRVDSIHSRLSMNSMEEIDAVTLPTKKGVFVGTGNYLVTVGFGTPTKKYALIFDTGSHFTWTQCEPCAGFCHDQVEPIFNPSKSKSYANITCRAATCNQISAEGMQQGCSSSTCLYGISYGDSSSSIGFLAKEKLTISRSDVFPGYLFGCGQQNQLLSSRVAGLIGLGRGKFSFVSQTAKKYRKIFSHCLPSKDSSVGYLTFGPTKLPKNIMFTPMPKSFQKTPFYGLDIIGINVAGQRAPINSSVFKTAGAIIDSGTVITRLPPTAYAQFKSAFHKWMTKYPRAPPLSILDTCYDFSGYNVIRTPTVSIVFNGGINVEIDYSGVLYLRNESQACLAFAKNKDAGDVAILGNFQQKTYEVVYDDVKGRVGFAPGGCL